MRVVVHHPERVEQIESRAGEHLEETIPASVSAYRFGRIEDFVNLDGSTTPKEEVAKILLEQAKEDFPGLEVSIEYLHESEHDAEGEVIGHEWRDHPPEQPVAEGEAHAVELSAEQAQEASA